MTAKRWVAVLAAGLLLSALVAVAAYLRPAARPQVEGVAPGPGGEGVGGGSAGVEVVADTPPRLDSLAGMTGVSSGLTPDDPALDTVTRSPEFEAVLPPPVTTILIRPDTVWLLGRLSNSALTPSSYGYIRATGEWIRRGPRPDLERGLDPLQPHWSDTMSIAPGVRLAHLPNHLTHFHMLLMEDGTTRRLDPEVPPAIKRRLVESIYSYRDTVDDETVAEFPVEGAVSAWLARDSTVWLGRAGSWTEMSGGLGGIVRYDLVRDRVESLWTEHLAVSTVSGLAFAGGRLWIGTLNPGEYGPWGSTGVLLYDPATGAWDRLTPGSSPLPDAVVRALRGVGDSVWVATDRGLAAVDAATGRWDVRHFRPALAGDTLVHVLEAGAPRPDPVFEVAYALMERLGVERRADFLEAVRGAPAGPFLDVYRTGRDWHRPLAHPEFVPFLVDAVRGGWRGRWLALPALGLVPASAWDPEPVRAVMRQGPIHEAVPAAEALARAGHADGLEWLRRAVTDSTITGDRSALFRALGEMRDTTSIPALASRLGGFNSYAAYAALISMRSDSAWRVVARAARVVSDLRRPILEHAVQGSLEAPVDDLDFQALLEEVARRDMEAGGRAGARYLLGRGHFGAAEALLDDMRTDPFFAATARTFVRVTGVDAAPFVPVVGEDEEDRARSVEFWTRWWAENGASFQPVDQEAGAAAVRRWEERGGG